MQYQQLYAHLMTECLWFVMEVSTRIPTKHMKIKCQTNNKTIFHQIKFYN